MTRILAALSLFIAVPGIAQTAPTPDINAPSTLPPPDPRGIAYAYDYQPREIVYVAPDTRVAPPIEWGPKPGSVPSLPGPTAAETARAASQARIDKADGDWNKRLDRTGR